MNYRVSFTMSNGSTFSKEVPADSVAEAAFCGTLDLVFAIEEQDRTDLLRPNNDGWVTTQALALQVLDVVVEEL